MAVKKSKPQPAQTVQTAPERLAAWMEAEGLNNITAAERLGCVQTYVSMLKHGRLTPSLKLATKIERITGIECSAWMPV